MSEDRVKARVAAEEAIRFIEQSAEGDIDHYWKIVREMALIKSPRSEKESKIRPMSTSEAETFENQTMRFGKFENHRIGDVPIRYLDWLLSTIDNEFNTDLKRYLLNEQVHERVLAAVNISH